MTKVFFIGHSSSLPLLALLWASTPAAAQIAPAPAPPVIEVQPVHVTATVGSSATFSIVASGTPPLKYHWFFRRLDVGGTASVTFNNVQLANDNTSVHCVVTNLYGGATSSVVKLFVVPPTPPSITSNPSSKTVTLPAPPAATDLAEEPLRGKTLRFKIQSGTPPFPGSGGFEVALASTGNTFTIPVGGAMPRAAGTWSWNPVSETAVQLALSNGFPGAIEAPMSIALQAGGAFESSLNGRAGRQGGTFQVESADGSTPGPTVRFDVAVAGTTPLFYQWQRNGVPLNNGPAFASASVLSGADSAALMIGNVTPQAAGAYSCTVSNRAGHITSAAASLVVNAPPAPDRTAPVLRDLQPSSRLTETTNSTVRFAGSAADAGGIAGVTVWREGSEPHPALGTAAWMSDVTLEPGTNRVQVWARDLAGNHSLTNIRTLVYTATNPPAAGVYHGLFYETNRVRHHASGFIQLALRSSGGFSASLRQGGRRIPFSGRFGWDGRFRADAIGWTGQNPLRIELAAESGGADRIAGTVGDGEWQAALAADRAAFSAANRPATNFAGAYTMLIPGSTNPPAEPAGDGSAAFRVDHAGIVRLTGVLADGSPFNTLVPLSSAGAWPLYESLYGGRGSMLGWIQLTNSEAPDLGGRVSWSRPPGPRPGVHTNGFLVESFAIGSGYRPPGTNTLFAGKTHARIAFGAGDLVESVTNEVTLHTGGTATLPGERESTLTLRNATGRFKGTMRRSSSNKRIPLAGVILQKQGFGGGAFLGTNQSGWVRIQPQAECVTPGSSNRSRW